MPHRSCFPRKVARLGENKNPPDFLSPLDKGANFCYTDFVKELQLLADKWSTPRVTAE